MWTTQYSQHLWRSWHSYEALTGTVRYPNTHLSGFQENGTFAEFIGSYCMRYKHVAIRSHLKTYTVGNLVFEKSHQSRGNKSYNHLSKTIFLVVIYNIHSLLKTMLSSSFLSIQHSLTSPPSPLFQRKNYTSVSDHSHVVVLLCAEQDYQ